MNVHKKILFFGIISLVLLSLCFWRLRSSRQAPLLPSSQVTLIETKSIYPTVIPSRKNVENPGMFRDFEELKAKLLASLPNKKDPAWREKFSASVESGTVPEILALGRNFGKLNVLVEKFPELQPKALELYANCATQDAGYDTVKVACLANYHRLARASQAADLDHAVSASVLENSLVLVGR